MVDHRILAVSLPELQDQDRWVAARISRVRDEIWARHDRGDERWSFYLNSRYQMFEHAGPMAPVSGIGDSEPRPEGSPESVASDRWRPAIRPAP
jgi:hypothetical protein